MILPNPLDGVQQHVQLLPRSHLDQQHVIHRDLWRLAPALSLHLMIRVDDRVLIRSSRRRYGQVEKSVLSTVVLVGEVARVDGRVDVQFRRVRLVPCGRRVTGTFDGEGEDDRVSVRHRLVLGGVYQQKATRYQSYSHPSSIGNTLRSDPLRSNPDPSAPVTCLGFQFNNLGSNLIGSNPNRWANTSSCMIDVLLYTYTDSMAIVGTSAISVRRRELAMDASTPMRSNSMLEGVRRWVSSRRPCEVRSQ